MHSALLMRRVRQYRKEAKIMEANRENAEYKKERFLDEVHLIQTKPEGERTVNELAKLKQYQDESWAAAQFDYDYDYDDDELCN